MEGESVSAKLLKELKDGVLILYRVKNHRLDYSIMNRPEPTLSGIDDHALATAIVYAGKAFPIVVDEKLAQTETVQRHDGREVTYNEVIDIDFERREIKSTRRGTMTLQALAGVVHHLMSTAQAPTARAAPSVKPKTGMN